MAKDLNKVMIIGNLTRDPELRTTPSGQSVANIGIATNRQWKDQNGATQTDVEFHDVVAWGKLAEIIHQYMKKGRRIYIEGRLQTRIWEGKEDGIKRYRTEVVANDCIFLDGSAPDGSGMRSAPAEASQSGRQEQASNQPAQQPAEKKEEEIRIEDIPF